jgi:valyl-tRNA synthetase
MLRVLGGTAGTEARWPAAASRNLNYSQLCTCRLAPAAAWRRLVDAREVVPRRQSPRPGEAATDWNRRYQSARDGLLTLTPWPLPEGLENPAAEAEIGWVVDVISQIRSVRTEMNVKPALQIPMVLAGVAPETAARADRWSDVIKRMARIDDISLAHAPPAGAVQLLVRGDTVALPLQGIIDLAAEKARLEKEKAKAETEIGRIDAKLSNPAFVAHAKEEVVEADRERREEMLLRQEKIVAALERLRQVE